MKGWKEAEGLVNIGEHVLLRNLGNVVKVEELNIVVANEQILEGIAVKVIRRD